MYWLKERTILAAKNITVSSLNSSLLKEMPGRSRTYLSIDTPEDPENNFVNYGPELLNKMEPTGVPPHELELKIGAPVMVLRNLDPPTVVNGTRLVIKKMH